MYNLIGDIMTFIKGNFKQYIFKSDKGYVVGLFKIKDASEDLKNYLNKTITFTGYFNTLNETDLYIFNESLVEKPSLFKSTIVL